MAFLLRILSFSGGVLLVGLMPVLPSFWWLLVIIPLAVLLYIYRFFQFIFFVFLGLCWGVFSGYQMMNNQLQQEDEGNIFTVAGWIEGLPQVNERGTRFWLVVDEWKTESGHLLSKPMPVKIQLNYYSSTSQQRPEFKPNDRLLLNVKLKASRGMVNFVGFDYQAWLMRKGIGATGSIIELQAHSADQFHSLQAGIDLWRWHLKEWILSSGAKQAGVLTALLIGENDYISPNDWLLMQRTGTSHLVAVSGLHVGFLALVGFFVGGVLGRLIQAVAPIRWRTFMSGSLKSAALFSLIFAAIYSALAGFNIPTLRTFIMIALFNLTIIFSLKVRLTYIYGAALVCTLIIDPLAGYDIGFWLSFGAVGLLILYFSGRRLPFSDFNSLRWLLRQLIQFLQSQWLMMFGLFIPLVIILSSISLISPLANFVAIPLITFLVVPLLLLGALLSYVHLGASYFLIKKADYLTDLFVVGLEALLNLTDDFATPVMSMTPSLLAFLAIVVFVQLLPRALGLMPLALIGWASVGIVYMAGEKKSGAIELLVFDVGQGTAVVIRDNDHTLVYDVGAKFSEKLNAATGIVLPYLQANGLTRIDHLIISHWDQDHAGGFSEFIPRMKVGEILVGEPSREQHPHTEFSNCHTYAPWQYGNIQFEFLVTEESLKGSANNRSCVLLVKTPHHRFLLPGDLEAKGEWALLRTQLLPQNLDVLLAGHHGSRSSSNPSFVKYLSPRYVVYSAGYKNAYRHPNHQVVERFEAVKSLPFNTASDGAIRFTEMPNGELIVEKAREQKRRYWFDG